MRQHPAHLVPARTRRAINNAMGSNRDPIANHRRTRLAIITAEYVLPLWRLWLPADLLPERMLGYANQLLLGNGDSKRLFTEYQHAWDYLEELGPPRWSSSLPGVPPSKR